MVAEIEGDRPRLVVLLGPTGVGKSRLAIELAEEYGGEILSADSLLVYKHMDTGTGKPTREEQKKVRHHLMDLVLPDQPFHAGLYRTLGRKTIDQLHRENKRPVWVVGGTGLYIKTLTQGLFESPPADPGLKEKMKREAAGKGVGFLYDRLKEVDPKTSARLHPNDLFRIIRALEVFESTGVPISFFREQHRFEDRPYSLLKIGLEMDRDKLYRRIEERVYQMLEQGFLGEVERLLAMGFGPQLKPMQSLGYKQLTQFLQKQMDWDETVRQIKRDTRRYAKRQWTWFKADPEVLWHDLSSDREKVFKEISSFLREEGQYD